MFHFSPFHFVWSDFKTLFYLTSGIARRGHYGSFLLHEPDLVVSILSHLRKGLTKCAVTAKIRMVSAHTLDESYAQTLKLAKRLELEAGVDMICVHPRTKEQKGQFTGLCDWDLAARVKQTVSTIPVVCNGGIGSFQDAQNCLRITNCDAAMSSEALLEYPALFSGNMDLTQEKIASDYLDCVDQFPHEGAAGPKCVKSHLFKFFYAGLQRQTELRSVLGTCYSAEKFREIVKLYGDFRSRERAEGDFFAERGWYYRYRKDANPDQRPIFPEQSGFAEKLD